MPERLVLATHNRKKGGEMAQILLRRFPSLEVKLLADYEGAPEPDETGLDYRENASIKAKAASLFTGEWSLADDAGLEIDAMGGAPGLHSKRFGGEDLAFAGKMGRILELMRDVPDESRGARFRCCVALASPEGEATVFEASCEGSIAREPKGEGGFGFDPIFYLPELRRHMAELTPDEKHAVSHRGKVLAMLGDFFDAALRAD